MISFYQLCEMLSLHQSANFFWFDKDMLQHLTPEELALVHIFEPPGVDNAVRMYYPPERFLEPHDEGSITFSQGPMTEEQKAEAKKPKKQKPALEDIDFSKLTPEVIAMLKEVL